jgi:hypothetical protein
MDGPPLPPAEPPALVAPAPTPAPPALPAPRVSLRLGAGIGGGNWGLTAAALLELDVWASSWLGVGFEGVLTNTETVALFVPPDKSSTRAGRVRFSVRHLPARNTFLSATLAVGLANTTVTHSVPAPCPPVDIDPDCGGPTDSPYIEQSEDTLAPTVALELAGGGQLRKLQIGGILRFESTPPTFNIVLGPTLGLAF